MLRKKHQEKIDQLVCDAASHGYKSQWVKFAFLNALPNGERLTIKEWCYLADKSGFTPLWAHEKYNKQESFAWHKLKLDPIEIELKKNETNIT